MEGVGAELDGRAPAEPEARSPAPSRSLTELVIATGVVVAVAALTVWSIVRTTPIDSDDAARPVLVDSFFRVGFSGGVLMPEDTYFTRIPIYLVAELLGGGLGRHAIVWGYFFTAVGVAAAAIGVHRVVVGRVVVVPAVASAVALIAITPLNLSIVRSSHRGLEVLAVMIAAIWLVECRTLASSRRSAALAAIVIAVCVSSEPYGMWLVAFPLAGLVLLAAVGRRSLASAEPAAWILGGVVGAQIVNAVLVAAGVDIFRFDNRVFPLNVFSIDEWEKASRAVRRALLGADTLRVTDVLPIAVAALWLAVWLLVAVVCWRVRRPGPVLVFGLLYPVLVMMAYVVTPNIDIPGTYRYVGPLMLALPLSVAVITASGEAPLVNWARTMTVAAAAVAVVNLPVFAVQSPLPDVDERQEAAIDEMLEVVGERGLDFGYAQYWNSHRSTVFSGGEVTVLPVVCGVDGSLAFYDWVTSRAATDREGPTFLLVDPTIEACLGNVVLGDVLWSAPDLGWTLVALDAPPPATIRRYG